MPIVLYHLQNKFQNSCDAHKKPFKSNLGLPITSGISILLPRFPLCSNAFHLHLPNSSLTAVKVQPKVPLPFLHILNQKTIFYSSIVPPKHILFFELYFFIQQVLISYLFYTYQCIHVNPSLPIHPITTSPQLIPLVPIRVFSTSVSLFLPCKTFHLYHFSRFHIYELIYNICFSLSDLLHSI